MDEVRADRLIEKHSDNSLLVIIHEWPQKKKYKEKPELIPSLEYLVSVYACCYLSYHDRIVQNRCERTINCLGSFGKSLSAFLEGLLHTLFFQFLPVLRYSFCRI